MPNSSVAATNHSPGKTHLTVSARVEVRGPLDDFQMYTMDENEVMNGFRRSPRWMRAARS